MSPGQTDFPSPANPKEAVMAVGSSVCSSLPRFTHYESENLIFSNLGLQVTPLNGVYQAGTKH